MKAKKSKAKTRKAAVSTASKPAMRTTTSQPVPAVTSFNWLMLLFVFFFLSHALVIYAANLLFPGAVVLGNATISPFMALMYSMVVFTLLTVGAMPLIEAYSQATKSVLNPKQWMVVYFVINFVALWLVARFAEMLGLGLASWMVVAALAVVLDVIQGMVAMSVLSRMK